MKNDNEEKIRRKIQLDNDDNYIFIYIYNV